ncbi:MAG: hypothetical protein ACREA8_03415 [Nitrosotalea sp.]
MPGSIESKAYVRFFDKTDTRISKTNCADIKTRIIIRAQPCFLINPSIDTAQMMPTDMVVKASIVDLSMASCGNKERIKSAI